MDGAGQLSRLAGDAIPYLARVLAVADVFDALTSHRPYRSALPVESAVAIIRSDTGTHFDPGAVAAFLKAVERGEIAAIMDGAELAATVQVSGTTHRRQVEDAA